MAGVVARVVNRLSSRPAGTSSTWTYDGFSYDVSIGGIPFLSGASKDRPAGRKTAPYKKDQIDQTPIPGEQSMVFWWLRSQISFHGGAGIKFEEPALDPSILYSDPLAAASIPARYQDGEGIDPWTQPGQVSLLPATTLQKSASGSVLLEGAVDGSGVDIWLQAEATTLTRCVAGSNASVTWGGSGTILSLTNDGTNYYVADNVGVWKGTLAGGVGTKAWNTGLSPVLVKWAKDRLIGCIGTSVYELVGAGAPTLPTATFTPNTPNWTWTGIEEGPDSIFLSGYAGNKSKIYSATLTSDAVPILGQPVEVATLPIGELVYSLKACEGSFLAIGTNRGVRVANINQGGRLQYGPLLVTTSSPVRSLDTYDRFIYAACSSGMADGTSGLYRIDLGFQTETERFAFGKDLRAHVSGTVRSVTQLGSSGRLVFSVDGHGSYLEHATQLEPTGYLQTGNIRFHTQEDKLFKYVRVMTAPLVNGTVSISVTPSSGGTTSLVTLSANSSGGDVGVTSTLGPIEWMNLTFTLARDGVDATKGPTIFGYQLKALPGQKNQRMIQVPILLFDRERDKFGHTIGGEGYARDRLRALETVEEARDNVVFQDLSREGEDSTLACIDDITFQQTDPPASHEGFGGYAVITLRTVT